MADIEIRLSGGAGNTDPDASLGGIMSSERVLSQSSPGIVNLTGITINYACGNALGAGTFSFTKATNIVTWTPFNGTIGSNITIAADGKYGVFDSTGSQQLYITVVFASLPASDQTDTITIANIANEKYDDITKSESNAGMTDYRGFYVINTHATESGNDITIWQKNNASGADSLELGDDPAGVGDGSSTGVGVVIANEITAPVGVTFTAPTTPETGINIGSLGPGQATCFWQKRTVPASTTIATPLDISSIGISALL